MGQKALLVVSFGTSYPEALEHNIRATEEAIGAAVPERTMFRAFTSGMILRKLARRDGVEIDDVAGALERIEAGGYTDVLIQPTHIMNGDEYDKLCAQAAPWGERLARIGAPLITAREGYRGGAGAMMEAFAGADEGEALVLMGHGTGHYANAAYLQLEYMLHDMGWRRAFLGTVEGYPGLGEVRRRLAECSGVRRVTLAPFMLVAGDHANNDMAGSGPGSWKSVLEADGYKVSCRVAGLGEYPGIRRIFAAHALAAEQG